MDPCYPAHVAPSGCTAHSCFTAVPCARNKITQQRMLVLCMARAWDVPLVTDSAHGRAYASLTWGRKTLPHTTDAPNILGIGLQKGPLNGNITLRIIYKHVAAVVPTLP